MPRVHEHAAVAATPARAESKYRSLARPLPAAQTPADERRKTGAQESDGRRLRNRGLRLVQREREVVMWPAATTSFSTVKPMAIECPGLQTTSLRIDEQRRLSGYRGHTQYQGDGDLVFGTAVYKNSVRGTGAFQLVRFEIHPR